jgi:hypothetical protein
LPHREANRSNGLVISGVSRLVSGVRRPRRRILGSEFAGEVAAAGPAVTRFGAGDCVFGNTGLRFGCHAEFTCVPQTARVAPMPAGVGFAEAAAATDGAAPVCEAALSPPVWQFLIIVARPDETSGLSGGSMLGGADRIDGHGRWFRCGVNHFG